MNFLPANITKRAIHEASKVSLTPSSIKPVCKICSSKKYPGVKETDVTQHETMALVVVTILIICILDWYLVYAKTCIAVQ